MISREAEIVCSRGTCCFPPRVLQQQSGARTPPTAQAVLEQELNEQARRGKRKLRPLGYCCGSLARKDP
jgi:hypothetical protein